MLLIATSFLAALTASFALIGMAFGSTNGALDDELDGAQKFHARPVPRLGGLAIYFAMALSLYVAYMLNPKSDVWLLLLMLAGVFAFGAGILEDWTKRVGIAWRLIATLVSAIAGYFLVGAAVARADVYVLDWLLQFAPVSLLVTALCVAGVANGINIIDGFNGLAAMVAIFIALSISVVALQVGDPQIALAALLLAAATAGFAVWNYPYGLIFLGDGGAYFLGFMLSEMAVLLVARHAQVCAWYAALVLLYPAFEVVFSIYRKKFVRGMSPGLPDRSHLHMLVFNRLVRRMVGQHTVRAITHRNAMTSPYLWALALLSVVPATLFWRYKWVLVACCILFVYAYMALYVRLVRFNAPQWLILRNGK